MSNRAERRAAERAANKTAKKAAQKAVNAQSATQKMSTPAQSVTTDKAMAAATSAMLPDFPFDGNFANETNQEPNTMPHFDTPASTNAEASPHEETSAEKLARIRSGYEKSTASEAQNNTNRENAQNSTGAKTPENKANVSQNRTHGFIGNFLVMGDENMFDFYTLRDDVIREYQPGTSSTEWRLVQTLIQHYWLMLRAVRLQDEALIKNPKMLPLYMRYQATHERSYYRAQKELQKLVKEPAQNEIGFEPQKVKQEAIEARTRLQHAKAESIEIDSRCKKVMAVPLPGMENVSFKELAEACSIAISGVVYSKQTKNAAA